MPHFPRSLAALVLVTLLAQAPQIRAESASTPVHDARRDRLEGLSKDDLVRLLPELRKGPVALVEFADMESDQLPGVNIAVWVNAPAERLARIASSPASYPRFMPTVDSVKVIASHEGMTVYDWAFDLAVLRMRGRNVMTVQTPSSQRPDAATRIMIESREGDLGHGRFLFRVHPQSGRECVLVLSMRLDLREANYVARQMAKAARSINRSANLALGFSMVLNLRKEAERASEGLATPEAPGELQKPELDVAALSPLLQRGDLVFFSMAGDRVDGVAVLGRIERRSDKVREVMRDARAFGSALVPGSAAKIVSEADGVTVFDWDIGLPFVGVSGRMRMAESEPGVHIDATDGALRGGRWSFEVSAAGRHGSLVTGWARFDFKNSTWLLEKMVAADPYLELGMTAASEVMLVRALRSRAMR